MKDKLWGKLRPQPEKEERRRVIQAQEPVADCVATRILPKKMFYHIKS